ncbi:MAG: NADH-quinone oxidoreductase subunit L [Chloroflexota bacterium]|nr:NADH-quinone oxidoreductase subunit L [Chloroflexota bacterium]
MINNLWLVPALPLAGAAVNAIFSRRMPRWLISAIGVGAVGLSFLVALLEFFTVLSAGEHGVFNVSLYSWIPVGDFKIDIAFLLDPLSALMLLVVTGVGFLIHVYSIGYMAEDESYGRFFTYLNLFVFSMLILVLGNNYLLMYVGWELVGLCSYLLISFWFMRPSAAAAGKKAFITTRIGDFGFGLGVILIFVTFGTLSFADVFTRAPQILALSGAEGSQSLITLITLLLFAGAVGKSAQLPLYVWLPDAMEGPTPVSALIHAATMVTAGVYMVARSHVLFSLAPFSSEVVAVIGTITALFAATIALTQMDLKRVLAYSTISQLGYMFLGVGVAAYGAGVFHLMTHAFFKALLFLAAGSVMHAMNGVIDMRQLGGLRGKMRWTYITFFAAALAISGFPLFSGFFSKDEILAQAFESGHIVLWAIGLLTAGLTAFYIFRAFFLTFHGSPRWEAASSKHPSTPLRSAQEAASGHDSHGAWHSPHESPAAMTIPLAILAVFAVIAGFVGMPRVLGPNLLEGFFAPVFGEAGAAIPAATEWLLIGASVAVGLIGVAVAYWFYIARPAIPVNLAARFSGIYKLLWNKYYVDELYNALFVEPGRRFAMFLWQVIDVQIIDGFANGLARATAAVSGALRGWQTGYARAYALMMLIGTVVVIGWLMLR